MKQIERNDWNSSNRVDSACNASVIGAGLAILLMAVVSPQVPENENSARTVSVTAMVAETAARARG